MEETEPGRSNTKEASCAWLVSVFSFEFFLSVVSIDLSVATSV